MFKSKAFERGFIVALVFVAVGGLQQLYPKKPTFEVSELNCKKAAVPGEGYAKAIFVHKAKPKVAADMVRLELNKITPFDKYPNVVPIIDHGFKIVDENYDFIVSEPSEMLGRIYNVCMTASLK